MGKTYYMDKARSDHKLREGKFAAEIGYSLTNSVIYDNKSLAGQSLPDKRYDATKISIIEMQIQDYLRSDKIGPGVKTAVLNFASYKNPGGGYMDGMIAQEEAICHCSTLYEVIRKCNEYYWWNKNNLNLGLYTNRMIYTPDVLVLNDSNDVIRKVDIITCAAPNASVGLRYGKFSKEECRKVFRDRTEFLFKAAAIRGVDDLVLGAWGCGVFKNDPEYVAEIMLSVGKEYDGYLRNVVYAIPKGNNCDTFLRISATI